MNYDLHTFALTQLLMNDLSAESQFCSFKIDFVHLLPEAAEQLLEQLIIQSTNYVLDEFGAFKFFQSLFEDFELFNHHKQENSKKKVLWLLHNVTRDSVAISSLFLKNCNDIKVDQDISSMLWAAKTLVNCAMNGLDCGQHILSLYTAILETQKPLGKKKQKDQQKTYHKDRLAYHQLSNVVERLLMACQYLRHPTQCQELIFDAQRDIGVFIQKTYQTQRLLNPDFWLGFEFVTQQIRKQLKKQEAPTAQQIYILAEIARDLGENGAEIPPEFAAFGKAAADSNIFHVVTAAKLLAQVMDGEDSD